MPVFCKGILMRTMNELSQHPPSGKWLCEACWGQYIQEHGSISRFLWEIQWLRLNGINKDTFLKHIHWIYLCLRVVKSLNWFSWSPLDNIHTAAIFLEVCNLLSSVGQQVTLHSTAFQLTFPYDSVTVYCLLKHKFILKQWVIQSDSLNPGSETHRM